MTTVATSTYSSVALSNLHGHQRNPRGSLGDLDQMVASIRARGVLQALSVVPLENAGHYRIVAGHRRAAAAEIAGLREVPCIIESAAGERPESDDVLDMLVENVHREGLTQAEQVRGVQQLVADFGMSAKAIGEQTGLPVKHARRLARVAKDEPSVAALHQGLDLDQALVLADFAGDEQAQTELVAAGQASRSAFERQARIVADRRAVTATVQALTAAGTLAYDADAWAETAPPTAQRVRRLKDTAGRPLDDEAHATCPGHVVEVEGPHWNRDEVTQIPWCNDPEAHGHVVPAGLRPTPPQDGQTPEAEEAARQTARVERRRVVRCNREWRAARTVRRQHLATTLTRRTAPKGTLDLVTRLVVGGARNDQPTALAELLGVEPGGAWHPQATMLTTWLGDNPTDAKRTLALLAVVASHVEADALHDNAWRNPVKDGAAAAYLAWLTEATGYDPCPVERLATGTMTVKQADQAHARADAAAVAE